MDSEREIYKDFTTEEVDILIELLAPRYITRLYGDNDINNNLRPWVAIFAKYLEENDKTLKLGINKYYYKQDTLDAYFPTNPNERHIAQPFNNTAGNAYLEIQFVNTTTGTKIYNYATQLCNAGVGYIDRQSLAVALTQNKNHRVKVMHANNTVWVLSNNINEKLVEQTLTLFPYIFDIKQLQENTNVINCCKAVNNNQPTRPFFKDIFKSLEETRKMKKINAIRDSLNARVIQKIQSLERDISRIKDNIADHENSVERLYNQLEESLIEKLGLELKPKLDTDAVVEILNYMESCPHVVGFKTIKSSNYDGNYDMLRLELHTPITLYESEPLEKMLEYRLSDCDPWSDKAKLYKAFKRIFIDEELTMYCQTFVKIDLAKCTMDASFSSTGVSVSGFNRLYQPHLSRFNCWGENKNNITKALSEGDLVAAINLMIIAAQNINFTDSAVFNNWTSELCNNSYLLRIKSLKSKADGNMWSIQDVIDQNEREEAAENSEEVGHPELEDSVPF